MVKQQSSTLKSVNYLMLIIYINILNKAYPIIWIDAWYKDFYNIDSKINTLIVQ